MPAAERRITAVDIKPLEAFAAERKARRAALLPAKRLRRVALGPWCTIYFESFETMLNVPAIGPEPYHAVFIRGPVVEEVGEGVEALARIDAPEPNIVAVRQNRLLATAFHPEVTGDLRFHEYFLGMVRDARAATV